ncbi:hypothetical protein [Streptosporangium sp. NPDC004631]
MIVEPITVLVLHCSRCNGPWLDDECEEPGHWASREQIKQAFKDGEYASWMKIGSRYLCEDCWAGDHDVCVERPPLKAVDEIRVLKERAAYTPVPAAPSASVASSARLASPETGSDGSRVHG